MQYGLWKRSGKMIKNEKDFLNVLDVINKNYLSVLDIKEKKKKQGKEKKGE